MTHDQVVESICIDFRQYEPQILLFCEVIRLISDGAAVVKRTPDHTNGIWIRTAGLRTMRWMEGRGLVDYVCESLNAVDLSSEKLASIASRVFQTRVVFRNTLRSVDL